MIFIFLILEYIFVFLIKRVFYIDYGMFISIGYWYKRGVLIVMIIKLMLLLRFICVIKIYC